MVKADVNCMHDQADVHCVHSQGGRELSAWSAWRDSVLMCVHGYNEMRT